MAGIKFNKMLYNQAADAARNSKTLMDDTLSSADDVLSTTIPNDFPDADVLTKQINDINQVCETGSAVVTVFDEWDANIAALEESGNLDEVSWGSYVNFDDSLLIYVDGNPYPIDQYVMGVLDGEHEAMRAYSAYYKGEITYSQMIEFMKTFAIMARSYGLAQTIYSDYKGGIHKKDHAIANGATKQCFGVRLFADGGKYADWAGVASAAAQASIETTGMVLAQNGEAISMYYTSSKTDKIFELAKQGLNYKEIIDVIYAQEIAGGAKLSYVDYKTEQITGEVPVSEMTSSLASVNLNGSAVVNVPFRGGDRTGSTVYTGSTGESAEKVSNLANTYGPGSNSYSGATTAASTTAASTTAVTTGSYTGGSSYSGVSSGSSSTTTTPSTPATPAVPTQTPNEIIGESELPTNKFKNDVPVVEFANDVTIIKDTADNVSYKVDNIDTNTYNNFINSLQKQGYTLSPDGTSWTNSKTTIKLSYNDTSNTILLNISSAIQL